MGEIQIQKVQRTVQVKDADNTRKKVHRCDHQDEELYAGDAGRRS